MSDEKHELSQKLDSFSSELENLKVVNSNLKFENEKLIKDLSDKISQLENEKNDLNYQYFRSKQRVNDLDSKNQSLKQIEENLSKEVSVLKINIDNTNMLNEDLNNKMEKISNEKFDLLNQIESFKVKENDLNEKIKHLESIETNLKSELSQLNQNLRIEKEKSVDAQRLYDASLVQIKELNEALMNVKEEQINMMRENELLSSKCEKLQNQVEELEIERDDCEKMRLDSVKKHDIQLKALNQNLANLRVELKSQNNKLTIAQQELNIVKGNNLELEAKLSNFMDERNQLLERCVNSEKMCEVFKTQNVEIKRKYEDTQAALQELGREHQELQVQNYKKSSYKWVDDSLVDGCSYCKKSFSVTNRKVIHLFKNYVPPILFPVMFCYDFNFRKL